MTPGPPENSDSDRVNPVEVDARGLRCPLPVIRLAQAARDAPAGTWIVVLASDPAARYDIPAWCRMRDHELREMTEIPDGQDVSSQPTRTEPTRRVGPSA
ncbi:MAG TPA: sulfurtransferase TusA family protein, partial [Dermatophilaceae bacterium]